MDANLLIDELLEIRNKRESLEKDRIIGPCNCEEHKEIKTREFGGGVHFVYQCNQCGEQRGSSLKKIEALKLLNGKQPGVFDPRIEEERSIENRLAYEEISSLWEEERRIINAIHGFPNYQSTILAEQNKLKEINEKLASFIDDIKEEFGVENAIRALINQTVLIKKEKYNKLRETTHRFTSEPELKSWFNEKLTRDFYIYPEVCGVHLSENVNVRIDYILLPKEHLINEGFQNSYFGVEVKYFNQENGFTHKTSRGLWQTISYNDSLFFLKNKEIKLKYSLIFSNLSFSKELMLVKNYGHEMENDQLEWRGMVHIANHARVGTLDIKGEKDSYNGWSINFAGGTYFSSTIHGHETTYSKSNEDIINKVRLGNF